MCFIVLFTANTTILTSFAYYFLLLKDWIGYKYNRGVLPLNMVWFYAINIDVTVLSECSSGISSFSIFITKLSEYSSWQPLDNCVFDIIKFLDGDKVALTIHFIRVRAFLNSLRKWSLLSNQVQLNAEYVLLLVFSSIYCCYALV